MRVSIILTLVSALAILTACDPSSINGSGTITSQDRNAAPFSSIDVAGSVSIVVSPGDTYSIRVETDDNMQQSISTAIANKALKIQQQNGFYTKATVYLTTPALAMINTHSSGSITVTDGFIGDGMIVYSDGPGNIDLKNVTLASLTTQINGIANLTVSGTADSYSCQHRGTGTIHAFDLVAKDCAVAIYNSGHAEVHVTDRLFADLLGSGNVLYKGSPHVTVVSKGTGTITKQP